MTKRRGEIHPAHSVRRDDASGSDDDAFEREMRNVVRIEPDPRGRVRAARRVAPPHHAAPEPDPVDDPAHDFVGHGVDRREVRKLKKGLYGVGDRRDLHGMTAAEACASVERFIDSSRHRGHRCVCIIHGRGLHSHGNTAILKSRVRQYLRSHRSVLAYADAPSSDGGAGAVYVLLRK